MLKDQEDKICFKGGWFNVKSFYFSLESNRVLFSTKGVYSSWAAKVGFSSLGCNGGKNSDNILAQEKRVVSRQLVLPLSWGINQPLVNTLW